MEKTKVTQKYQTTIPKKIREILNIKPGEEVEWYFIQGKVKEPVKFLTSQIKLHRFIFSRLFSEKNVQK